MSGSSVGVCQQPVDDRSGGSARASTLGGWTPSSRLDCPDCSSADRSGRASTRPGWPRPTTARGWWRVARRGHRSCPTTRPCSAVFGSVSDTEGATWVVTAYTSGQRSRPAARPRRSGGSHPRGGVGCALADALAAVHEAGWCTATFAPSRVLLGPRDDGPPRRLVRQDRWRRREAGRRTSVSRGCSRRRPANRSGALVATHWKPPPSVISMLLRWRGCSAGARRTARAIAVLRPGARRAACSSRPQCIGLPRRCGRARGKVGRRTRATRGSRGGRHARHVADAGSDPVEPTPDPSLWAVPSVEPEESLAPETVADETDWQSVLTDLDLARGLAFETADPRPARGRRCPGVAGAAA